MKLKLNLSMKMQMMITAFLVAMFVVSAMSMALADSVEKKRRFEGTATLGVCRPKPGGGWEKWDEFVIPNLTFDLSVRELINEKEFTTNSFWEGTTKRGQRVRIRLTRAGKAKFNPAAGDLSVDLVFEIETGGKRITASYTASTDHIVSVDSSFKGDSAKANLAERSLSFALAGEKEVKVASELVELERRATEQIKGKAGAGSPSNSDSKVKSGTEFGSTVNVLLFGQVKGKAISVER